MTTASPSSMTPDQLREFLTTMREFGVFECSAHGMSFKISSAPSASRPAEESPEDMRVRLRDEMKELLKSDQADEMWST